MNIPKEKQEKFYRKSKKMTFVGYDGVCSNYRLEDKETCNIFVISDVDLNEGSSKCHESHGNESFRPEINLGSEKIMKLYLILKLLI